MADASRAAGRASRPGLSPLLAGGVVLGVLGASAMIGRRNAPDASHPAIRRWYERLDKPGFMPPDAVFGMAWPLLETGLALGGYRLLRRPPSVARDVALALWLANGAMICGWTLIFFRRRAPPAAGPRELTVWHDGSCPLCRREIALMRRLDRRGAITFVDASDGATACPRDRAELLARFHARENGQMLSGAAAFAAMWRGIPLLRPLGLAARNRGVLAALELGYRGFLRARPVLIWACDRTLGSRRPRSPRGGRRRSDQTADR